MAIRRFLTLDIGASSLKLAEFVLAGGKPTLVNYAQRTLKLDPSSDEDRNPHIVAALRDMMAVHRFRASVAAVSVSGQVVLTRFMKLPAADEAKMRQMVRYEAAQNVPFPIEEVVWDYQVVGSKGQTDLDVALVAIKSEIIEGFNRSVDEVGLRMELVDVAPLAIYNAALYNYETGEECILMLDIGARTTNLIFIEEGKVFTRSIPIAGNTITQNVAQEFEISFAEAEEVKVRQGFVGLGGAYEEPEPESAARLSKIIRNVMTRLHAEVARSINFYKSQQGGKPPRRLLLCGGSSIIMYTDHFFREKMEIEVEYFNPFRNVAFDMPPEELEKTAHTMGEMVGLGLRLTTECPIEINLIPPTVTRRRLFQKKIPYLGVTMLGLIFITLSWWVYFGKVRDELQRYNAQIAGEVAQRKDLDEQLRKAEADLALVRLQSAQLQKVAQARFYWIQFFSDLSGRIPRNSWITRLTPANDGHPLSHTGTAPAAAATSAVGRRGPLRRWVAPMGELTAPSSDGEPAAAHDASAALRSGITEFEIQGLCLNDRGSSEPLKPVEEFWANLVKSPYFSEVKIIESANPVPTDWTFSFRLRAKLKNPVAY